MSDTTDTDTTNDQDPANEDKAREEVSTVGGEDVDQTDASNEDNDGQGGNAEAAKWRHKTRDAETQRDTARTQLDAQRTAILHRMAAQIGVTPALLEASGVKVDDLLDDDGLLDHDAASTAVEKVCTDNRLPRRPAPVGTQGHTRDAVNGRHGWSDVIGGNVRTSK